MSLFSLSPDVVHLVLKHLINPADKLTLRTVCKESRQIVDFDSVQHLRVDRAALVTEDALEPSPDLRHWPSPATLQMWGRSVRALTVGDEAGVNERLQWLLQRGGAPSVPVSEGPAPSWWEWHHTGQAESEQDEELDFFGSEGDEGLEWQGETQPGVLPAQPGLPPSASQAAPQGTDSGHGVVNGASIGHAGVAGLAPAAQGVILSQAIGAQGAETAAAAAAAAGQGFAPAQVHGAAGQGAVPVQAAGAQGAAAAAAAAAGSNAHTGRHLPTEGQASAGGSRPSQGCDWDMQGLRLQKLPLLCSRLPQLSTLRLWGMELSAQDFAAAAVHCPQLTSLEYLAPPPIARQMMPQGFPSPRHVRWDGGLWTPLSQFPCLYHLTLKGWCFAGSEGLKIGLLTGLRRLDIESCTNQSTDGVGLSCISHLTNLTHLTFSRIRYPHPIPSEFSGLSAIKGLSSLTAIDGDFFPEEVLAWADMHLTRLTLSSSYNLTLHGMAGLVPQLKSLVVLEVPDLMLDLRMVQGLVHMPALRELCVAWIHVRPHHPVSQHLELPQVQHLALQYAYEYDVHWEGSIGAILPNVQSLQLAAKVDVARASSLATTLFEKPLPALTTLIASACFLTVPQVAAACPAVTSLGIIDAKSLALHMPLEWRCKITRLALMGSLGGNISQFLGRDSGFQNLQELALLAFAEEERTDWMAVCRDLDCSHLKAITLFLCPDVGALHVYCLASQSPNLEEMRVFRCPRVTRQQCQQMVSLLSKSSEGILSSPETMTEEECVCAARQQAAEVAQVADIKASDFVECKWKYFYSRITPTHARPRAVPFDIVCREAASGNAQLHNGGGGRHLLASLAWRAMSSHSYFRSSA